MHICIVFLIAETDDSGRTPLDIATEKDHNEVIDYLKMRSPFSTDTQFGKYSYDIGTSDVLMLCLYQMVV